MRAAPLLLLQLAAPAAAGSGTGGDALLMSCPRGQVIGDVLLAEFGSEPCANSSPAGVIPQVERLCRGRASCSVACNCSQPQGCHLDGTCNMPHHPPAPHPPGPPPPPAGPQPPAPPGFKSISHGSCRDSAGKEPPFYAGDAANVSECLSTCAADSACTAVSYCTERCAGACHIYSDARTPPAAHPGWSYSPGQHGNPHNVTTVAPGAPFWWCYAKVAPGQLSAPPPPPPLQCSCFSGELELAVPGVPCGGGPANTLTAKVKCVAAGPPPPPPPPQPSTAPSSLRLEFLEAPVLGVDKAKPHFSWAPPVPAESRRMMPLAVQSAAEVAVHDSSGQQVWSSGRVNGSTPLIVPTTPLPLQSDRVYTWAVRVWAEGRRPSSFSANATFTTGLLQQSDWGDARWIVGGEMGEARMLRKEFTVGTARLGRASLFVSACQYLIPFLDGLRIGDHELDVMWTKFAENRSYVTYELDTAKLPPGKHVLGMELGQGFCGGSFGKAAGEGHTRAGLLYLVLHGATPESKVVQTVVSDDSWTAASGPVLWDSTYYGEDYDARLEQPGWTTVDFKPTSKWTAATIQTQWPVDDVTRVTPMSQPHMSSQLMQPIRAVRELAPVSINKIVIDAPCPAPHSFKKCPVTSYVYDFAQEFAGIARLKLPPMTKAGTNVSLMYAEALAHPGLASRDAPDAWHNAGGGDRFTGEVYMKNLFWAHPIDSFVARGGSAEGEEFQAHFTEHGFRYVQLSVVAGSLPTEPNLTTIVGVNLRTDSREQSTLHFGDPLLQRLSDNSKWGEAAALMSIPNGAAGRGERAGWTGDSAFASESECFDYDTGAFFTQFMGQIRDGQCPDGTIGSVVPSTDPRRDGPLPFGGNCSGLTGDATWDTVYPTIAHNLWQYYGAIGVVRDHWQTLKLYVGFLEKEYAKSGIRTYFCKYGDWNPVVKTPCQVTSSMSFLHDVHRMTEMATALGETSDATHYRALLAKLKPEWHSAFWDPTSKSYSTGTQMAQAAALWLDGVGEGHIVPPSELAPLVAKLATDCVANGVTIGFVGVRYLFEALSKHNRTDAALACIARPGYPGFHYEIYNEYEPSSTLWESWDVNTQKCITCETSRNHHYRASINTFLRKYVAGLDMVEGTAAWDAVRVRPEAALLTGGDTPLPSASATIGSHRGVVHAAWAHHPATGSFALNVTVPAGARAEIHVPKLFGPATEVSESGRQLLWAGAATASTHTENGEAAMELVGDDGRFVQWQVGCGEYFFQAFGTKAV
jgi:alpha-L-rhamnosidase